jgi:hypothetical protein
MDRLDALNERRAKIYEDIKRLISAALGPDVDLDDEAKTVIRIWYESPYSNRENPQSPLGVLLLEHDRVDSQIEPIRVDAELIRTEETARSIRQQIQALVASIEPSHWTRNAAVLEATLKKGPCGDLTFIIGESARPTHQGIVR